MTIKPLRNAEIDAHPILDPAQKATLKAMRNATREIRLYDFARIALQATACDYAHSAADDTAQALQRAALLFAYEALKACDHDSLKQWPDFDTLLQQFAKTCTR